MTNSDRYNEFFHPIVDTLVQKHQLTVDRETKANSGPYFTSGYGSHIQYEARLAKGNKARVALHIDSKRGEWNKQLVRDLLRHREQIESALGPLDWEQEKETRRRRIEITIPGSIDEDAHTLAEIQDWMVENLLKFRRVFNPYLNDLTRQ